MWARVFSVWSVTDYYFYRQSLHLIFIFKIILSIVVTESAAIIRFEL